MKKPTPLKSEQGFTLVQAIFILVVLAALGSYLVTIAGVQSRTPVMALQGDRAYHAARSGGEWGIYQAVNGACAASSTLTIADFDVTVTCQSRSFTEAGSHQIFQIESLAEQGSYGSVDYVSRRLQIVAFD